MLIKYKSRFFCGKGQSLRVEIVKGLVQKKSRLQGSKVKVLRYKIWSEWKMSWGFRIWKQIALHYNWIYHRISDVKWFHDKIFA